jgi:signal transduction histidine kinase
MPTFVMLDTNKMIRVFNNIIENSKKYIADQPGKIEIILREAKANVIIEIRDNGRGIDETALPSIFDRFYRADKSRTNVSGSGLGLAICRQIVEGHKGRIWAKSKPGEGTSIIMSIPKIVI